MHTFAASNINDATLVIWIIIGLSAVWWLVQAIGTVLVCRGVPRLDNSEFSISTPEPLPKISVIVPARNEAQYIETALLSKLSLDYPDLELIFINDRSTDITGNIAETLAKSDSRLQVVHMNVLPDGWLGKIHALDVGTSKASGEWLLFADADVHLNEDVLKRAMTLIQAENLDHLTTVPSLVHRSSILSATLVGFMRLLMIFTRSWKTLDPNSTAFFGCGAFNMVKRSFFEKTPGFSKLKMEISDDGALGAMMKAYGARQKTAFLGTLGHLDFYPDLKSLFIAMEKQGALTSLIAILVSVSILVIFETSYAVGLLFTSSPKAWLACLAIYIVAVTTQVFSSKMWVAPTFPAILPGWGSIIFGIALIRAGVLASIRGGVYWRNTFYTKAAVRSGAVFSEFVKGIKTSQHPTSNIN